MKRGSFSQGVFTLGIAGLFLAGFFLLVTFGAATYRETVEGQGENNRTRSLVSYLSTCLKANDRAGALSWEACTEQDGLNGALLTIADGDSGYALRIYQWEGQLLEDYGPADGPLQPEDAQVLGETALFEIQERDGLAYVVTDGGEVPLRLRSGLVLRCGKES